MTETHATDVLIVGAGPVGLFGVFECGQLKMRCHVVDALEQIGGQCAALYPDKPIYDIPGLPSVSAGELIDRLSSQAAPYRPIYHLGQTVLDVDEADDGKFISTLSGGDRIASNAVIIAAGGGELAPNKPPLAGIERYEGTHVLYRVKSVEHFRDRRVVIAGGGDSAVDWALVLAHVAKEVMLVHRRSKFRASPASVEVLHEEERRGSIRLIAPYQLHALVGDGATLRGVTVRQDSGATLELEADLLLALFGIAPQLGPIARWRLGLDHQQIQIQPGTSETSRAGIYAAGDITTYPGKLKLILTGFAEVAMAAHHLFPRVHRGETLHFQHSTTLGVPA